MAESIRATVRAGQEMQVRKIDGEWIGTAVEVNGKLVGGWIQQDAVELVRKGAGAAEPPAVGEKPAVEKSPPAKPAAKPETKPAAPAKS